MPVLLFVAVCLSPCAAQTSGKAQVYALLQQHRFAEAESTVRSLLHQRADDCALMTMLGMSLDGQGKVQAAMEALQQELHACPTFIPGLEKMAELAYQHHLPQAPDLLEQLLQAAPANATAHAMLAAVRAGQHQCEQAVKQYALAGDLTLSSASAVLQDASCLRRLNRRAEAKSLLNRALAARESGPLRRALATMQLEDKQPETALATLQPLLDRAPENDQALLLAAQIAESEGKTPEAIAFLRKAIQEAPKRVENYLYFANLSFTHGSHQVGLDFLNLGLAQVPNEPRLLLARGVLEVQLSNFDAALTDFQNAHRLAPNLSFANDALGMLLTQKHDLAGASQLFAERLKTEPDDPLLHYLYAESLSESGSRDETKDKQALASARRAVELEPDYQPARDLLCTLLLRQGDLPGTIREATLALERDPNDEAALYQALLAQRRSKHPEETAQLVKRLQEARQHNEMATTQYILKESGREP